MQFNFIFNIYSLIGFNANLNNCWQICSGSVNDNQTNIRMNNTKINIDDSEILPSPPPPVSPSNLVQKQRSLNKNRAFNSQSSTSWPILVMLIWLFSLILSIPHCLFNQVVVYPSLIEEFEMERCASVFPNEQTRLMLAILSPLSQYLLPIGLTAMFYASIGCFLSKRSDPIGNVSECRRVLIMKRKRKRIKMLVIVVAVFAICWFPLHLYVTLIDFKIVQHHFGNNQ